jgi:hypothetical protein
MFSKYPTTAKERRNHRPPPQLTGLKRKMSALSKYHGGYALRRGTGTVKR